MNNDYIHRVYSAIVPEFIRERLRRRKALFNAWHSIGREYLIKSDVSSLVPRFEKESVRKLKHDERSDKDFWCMYMAALCEVGRREDAKEIFRSYYDRYHDIKGFERYLRVADLSYEMGIRDPEIDKAKRVYDLFLGGNRRSDLVRIFRDRTVAVIGNGPREIGKGLGEEIDGHDIVVRFNNIKVEGYERDYGSKTTVWVKHMQKTLRHDIDISGLQLVIYESDIMRFPLVAGYAEAILADAEKRAVYYCDKVDHSFYTDKFNLYPTCGILIVELLRKLPIKYLDAYGFSFLDDAPVTMYTHYCTDRKKQEMTLETGWHDAAIEAEYLRGLFKGGRRLNG